MHTIIKPSFHFGSANIAARGREGAEKAGKEEEVGPVGQALVWLVIREADPALSSHSESKVNRNVQ